jgi:hypothetical protein
MNKDLNITIVFCLSITKYRFNKNYKKKDKKIKINIF